MTPSEDRHITINLTEMQYSAMLDIFRRAKVTVDESPLAAEILDALVRGAKVSLIEQVDPDGSTPLGKWHSLGDLKDLVGDTDGRPKSMATVTTDGHEYQTMGVDHA